jgi:hypothetical protein
MTAVAHAVLALTLSGAPTFAERDARTPRPEPMEKVQRKEGRERVEKRIRLMRLVEIADRLELDDRQAMKINETLQQFDERKRTAHEEMKASRQALKRAAEGEATASKEIDVALDRVLDGRKRMLDLDQDLYRTLSRDLTPKQRARLAIFLLEFQHKMHRMAREARD